MNLKFRAWDEQFQSMSEVIDIDYRPHCSFIKRRYGLYFKHSAVM
ncbi:hypothetical protein CHPC1247_0045 [Streptococcus phage CHPC1247]|uniref:Uncharacterized protein n=2 Tax=Brussowvirus TaxID=1623303 RepID=A0A3G8FBX6_9CAUD|nr:hypothetical protein PQE92_gp45 [Streptococcus phage CHPC1247]YP_010682676.1 hypothetical protein PQE93_gp51 [Streptococcus phage CHPC1248]AZF92234.1 hypothetical protein CHPC1247_0045 [Streptococcus phage CHPC1247]AZF92288.1 hypothetical protein CHPC1248_0051 [Streptococcus phage CHPC1248]